MQQDASRLYWCLGMYASASTWMFNAMRQVALTLYPDQLVKQYFAVNVLNLNSPGVHIVKSHDAVPIAEKLFDRADAIIITMRDARDAIASLVVHNKLPFAAALDMTARTFVLCERYSSSTRAITLRFEDRFFDDPATLDRIAMIFGGELTRRDHARLYVATRRASIEQFIATLETRPTADSDYDVYTGQTDTWDSVTQWHKHHAGRRAEIGRWRHELSAVQIEAIESRFVTELLELGFIDS